MPSRRNREIEQQADALRTEQGQLTAPIRVDELAFANAIEIHYESFPDDGVSAMLYRQPDDEVFIVLNSSHHPNRQRFSIAHELGHFRLHEAQDLIVDGQATVHFRDARAASGTHRQEREANAFAAALLMPDQLVSRRFEDLSNQQPRMSDEAIADQLAVEFEVSERAMMLRLLNLALVVSI